MNEKILKNLAFIALYFAVSIVNSQEIETSDDLKYKKTFFTGGNIGLQFGTVTMIDISPQFGYYIFENLCVGAGATYQYINDRRYFPRAEINVYGGRIFTRFHFPFFNSIFAHGEYEYMVYNTNVFSSVGKKEWIDVSNYFLGIGYRQRVFGRSSITLTLLWNFNESMYSPYTNPIIRAGFDIDL
jgi:hypothetical protein